LWEVESVCGNEVVEIEGRKGKCSDPKPKGIFHQKYELWCDRNKCSFAVKNTRKCHNTTDTRHRDTSIHLINFDSSINRVSTTLSHHVTVQTLLHFYSTIHNKNNAFTPKPYHTTQKFLLFTTLFPNKVNFISSSLYHQRLSSLQDMSMSPWPTTYIFLDSSTLQMYDTSKS